LNPASGAPSAAACPPDIGGSAVNNCSQLPDAAVGGLANEHMAVLIEAE